MKEYIKIPQKEPNEMEISNLSDAEFKTLGIRMLKDLSENLDSIKKIQSEATLIEIKPNLKGNNSRVDEVKNQINDWNIRKQKNPIRTRKKNPPKMRTV